MDRWGGSWLTSWLESWFKVDVVTDQSDRIITIGYIKSRHDDGFIQVTQTTGYIRK